jgi:hypothetical protein
MMTPLGQAATKLAAKGIRVFPCNERAKEPAIFDNLKRATTDTNLIAGWWQHRNFNIGVATGPGSGIWVLDIDGDEGEGTLRALEAADGALPPTVEAITGKGRHLYFRWPNREIRNAQCRDDLPGLDWRGNGGYVLAPPSVHPSGRVYAWSVDSASEFADAPEWLIDIVMGKRGADGGPKQAAPPESWRTFLREEVEGSRRGAAVARYFGLLVRKYLDPYVALDTVRMFNTLRCRPPLADDEVWEICNAIADREAERRGVS